jgi:hypothetical protein
MRSLVGCHPYMLRFGARRAEPAHARRPRREADGDGKRIAAGPEGSAVERQGLNREVAVLGWLRRRKLGESGRRRLLIALARAEEELIETHVANAVDVIESVGDA